MPRFSRSPYVVAFGCALLVVAFARPRVAEGEQPRTASPTQPITAQELMDDVRALAAPEFEGRRTGTPGNARARSWIAARFTAVGLLPIGDRYEIPFEFTRNGSRVPGINVVGLCKGSGSSGDGAMVISAHYDHLGVRDGAMHAGADDNASGVATILALARRCARSPWTHDAVFVAFDAEEQGLQGARAFVANPPMPRPRLNVNLDMVSRGDKGELYVAGTSHRPELKPPLDAVAARSAIKLRFGHDKPKDQSPPGQDDWTMQSDHGPFHAAGIPFVYFGVEDHPDYHKPTDTPEKIPGAFFEGAARTILDAVTMLDRALPVAKQ
jgi:hypothetical protein